MQSRKEIEIAPLEIKVPGRLRELVGIAAQAFNQSDINLVARPMGIDIETCQLAAQVGKNFLADESLTLDGAQLNACYYLIEFIRRELSAEFHAKLRDLQKTMASIVTARTSKELEKLASELPKQAERGLRDLRALIKQRGALLDDCESIIKKLSAHLQFPKYPK